MASFYFDFVVLQASQPFGMKKLKKLRYLQQFLWLLSGQKEYPFLTRTDPRLHLKLNVKIRNESTICSKYFLQRAEGYKRKYKRNIFAKFIEYLLNMIRFIEKKRDMGRA